MKIWMICGWEGVGIKQPVRSASKMIGRLWSDFFRNRLQEDVNRLQEGFGYGREATVRGGYGGGRKIRERLRGGFHHQSQQAGEPKIQLKPQLQLIPCLGAPVSSPAIATRQMPTF